MRNEPFCAAALAACLVFAVSSADASYVHHDKCHATKDRTVALTKLIRVNVEDYGIYYSCIRRTGKRTSLFESDDLYTNGIVLKAAGVFVATEVSYSPECKADCPPDVHGSDIVSVTDARTGKARTLHDGPVGALFLRPSGAVAWLVGAAPDAELDIWTSARRTLDTGDVTDVHVEGGKLVWTNAGTRHTVAFA
jgi:hypothetical protein